MAGCSRDKITAALQAKGLLHEIRDQSGRIVASHERKGVWLRPNGEVGLNGVKPADMLYGAELLPKYPHRAVVICEGEKAADALRTFDIIALATVTGASATPTLQILKSLDGRKVALWPDNDDLGRQHMDRIARLLVELGIKATIVKWPAAPPKGDAADLVAAGADEESVRALLQSAEPFTEGTPVPGALIGAGTLKPKPIRWVWRNRIARGKMTVAGGDPGGGKSMLSVDWAARMSTGRQWPDGTQAPTCKSALVSAEDDPEDTIVPRLIAHDADLGMIVFPRALDLSTDADAFFNSCEAAGVEVVFIDPISAFVGPDTNTWRDSDMRRFLKPIAEAAARTNIAVVLIVHLTKANGGKALYRFQGSIAQAAAPRMAFLIAALPSDPEVRVMAAVKNNIGQKADSLSYRISSTYVAEVEDDIGRITWLGTVALTDSDLLQPEGESKALDRAEEFLLDYLGKGPQASKDCEAAAKVRKIGHNTLWDAKKELGVQSRKDGLDRWLWALPSSRIEPPRAEGDASPSVEPSRSQGDTSGAFNSNPPPQSHIDNDSSSKGNRTEASYRHGGTQCEHPHVRFAHDLLTCLDCGSQRHPPEAWPAELELEKADLA